MAFLLHSTDDGRVPPWEYLPADDATYTIGQALVMTGGHLVSVASGVGEDTDEGGHYICMAEVTVATDGDLIPVVVCAPGQVWETTLSAQDTDIAAGTAYTMHTDGKQITGTTTKGCCTVVSFDDTAAGAYARVRVV